MSVKEKSQILPCILVVSSRNKLFVRPGRGNDEPASSGAGAGAAAVGAAGQDRLQDPAAARTENFRTSEQLERP